MKFDTSNFRQRYRSAISPRYNPWLHAAFVLVFGVISIGFFFSHAANVRPWEWLAVPAALVLHNWGEYKVHKNLGHHKHTLGAMFYKRHTGDHHSFFARGQMSFEYRQDWRVILFPPWLIVAFSLALLPFWWLLDALNPNMAALFIGSMIIGYLSYEIFHACEHLPSSHPVSRLPWIRQMRRLHELHHDRDLMQTHNFNLVFPLWDWIYGTLDWHGNNETDPNAAKKAEQLR